MVLVGSLVANGMALAQDLSWSASSHEEIPASGVLDRLGAPSTQVEAVESGAFVQLLSGQEASVFQRFENQSWRTIKRFSDGRYTLEASKDGRALLVGQREMEFWPTLRASFLTAEAYDSSSDTVASQQLHFAFNTKIQGVHSDLGPDGRGVIAWMQEAQGVGETSGPSTRTIQIVTRKDQGWSAPQLVLSGRSEINAEGQVLQSLLGVVGVFLDKEERAHLVWLERDLVQGELALLHKTFNLASGEWSATQQVLRGDLASVGTLVHDEQDAMSLAFREGRSLDFQTVVYSDGQWQSPAQAPLRMIDNEGAFYCMGPEHSIASVHYSIPAKSINVSVSSDLGQSWGESEEIEGGVARNSHLNCRFSPTGELWVAWGWHTPIRDGRWSASRTRSSGGIWGPVSQLGELSHERNYVGPVSAAFDESGRGVETTTTSVNADTENGPRVDRFDLATRTWGF